MRVCDYSRSFATFVLPVNTARLQLEGRCLLTLADGTSEEFLMFASCKSEVTYAERDLFTIPNYDFSGIFSTTHYRLERIHSQADRERLDVGTIAGRFDKVRRHVVEVSARPLADKQAVVDATLAHEIIIARNELHDDASGQSVILEYPVKTMNVHPNEILFQTDTGPLPYYDFADDSPELLARCRWAYCAFNDFVGAEFILQTPTPIVADGREVAQTSHYSHTFRLPDCRNSLYALEG